MGCRAEITFVNNAKKVSWMSPTVYVHWAGDCIAGWLKEAGPTLRVGDVSYASARFIGFCHNAIDGELSLGVYDSPKLHEDADIMDYSNWNNQGDYGHYIVDVSNGNVYHADYEHETPVYEFDIELCSG